jgi:hypothetical protein
VLLGAPIAQAQESPPVRVRGTIEQVDGPNLVVKSRDGPGFPNKSPGGVSGRSHFRLRARFQLSVASAWLFFGTRLHGGRVWVSGSATTASPVSDERT